MRHLGAGAAGGSEGAAGDGQAPDVDSAPLQRAASAVPPSTASHHESVNGMPSLITLLLMGLALLLLMYVGSGVWSVARSVQRLTQTVAAGLKQASGGLPGGSGADAEAAARLVLKHLQAAAVGKAEL